MKKTLLIIVGCICMISCDNASKSHPDLWAEDSETANAAPPKKRRDILMPEVYVKTIQDYIINNPGGRNVKLGDGDKYELSIKDGSIVCKAANYTLILAVDSVRIDPLGAISNEAVQEDIYELVAIAK